MDHLYRVVPVSHWREALRSGFVPRCAADSRLDRIHLNRLEDVGLAADLWFTPEEDPVALEVDVSSLSRHLRWEPRQSPPDGLWPNLYVHAIPAANVVRVFTLEHRADAGEPARFRVGAALAAPGACQPNAADGG